MKNLISIFLIPLFLVSAYATITFAGNEKLIIVVGDACPPYMYGSMEKAKGLYSVIIKEIFATVGIDTTVLSYPWKRAFIMAKNGEAVVGGIFKTEERLKIFDYTDYIYEEKLSIYVKKGNTFHYNSISDLKGKLVGVNRGWSYGEVFDNAAKKGIFKTQEVDSNISNLKNLILGRIDCVIIGKLSVDQIIQQENFEDEIEEVPHSVIINKSYVAFAKKLNQQHLIEKFNFLLEKMKKDGSYNKMINSFIQKSK